MNISGDKRRAVYVVYFDLSKAFGMISHSIHLANV